MAKSLPKDWRALIDAAEEAGWRIRFNRGKGGYLLYPANKALPPIPLPATPSPGKRALQNKRAELKRAGLDV